ncbi:MAG: DNA-binding protein [Betaproteobacteria bacterium]
MSLESLVGVSLEKITPAKQTVRRLLDAVSRHIADAKVGEISAETRFGSAYTAIRMLADVGLHAHGFRTLTSKPGHHQAAIQSLVLTLGVDNAVLVRLDRLRKQRNLTEYSGDTIPQSAVDECLRQAQSLQSATMEWLKANRPELL